MPRRLLGLLGALPLALAACPSLAQALPPPVAAMIEAAASDPAALKAVAAAARKTNPEAGAEIDAILARLEQQEAAARAEKLAAQGFLEGWTGEGQIGAFASTGNSQDVGLALGVGLARESLSWRHRFEAAAD